MRTFFLLKILTMVLCFAAQSQTTVFVKHDASGNNDGTSWTDAYTSLQTALAATSSGQNIWVAAGTYTPSLEVGGTGNRFKAFQLKNGVGLYGGFAGNEDLLTFDLNDRDYETNATILSGNLGSENVYHVFRHVSIGLNSTAVLDGFTISEGLADGSGSDNKGGGMLNSGSSAANGSSPAIRNSVFKDNTATEGGALYNSRYCNPMVSGTAFLTNTASEKGGAVLNVRNAPVFSYCKFEENNVTSVGVNDGGGAIYNSTSVATEGPTISYCFFYANSVSSTSKGGAVFSYLNPGKINISHCTFNNNTAQYGGALFHNSGSDINRDASNVQINNSTFEENNAMYGGAIFSDRHNTIVTSCKIRGNEASQQSGGFYSRIAFSKLINTLITGNKSGKHGGGVYFNAENPEIINSTITGNYSGERGGGISTIGSSVLSFKNSILYGNSSAEGAQLWICETCAANIDYSLFGNASGDVYITPGGIVNATNSMNSDPEFLNPFDPPTNTNTPNILGNYYIDRFSSPAIDAGLNSHVPAGIAEDLTGTSRIMDGNGDTNPIVDLGPYEFDPNGCYALAPSAGDGSVGNPYEISILQHLFWIAEESSRWDKHYIQTADIDASTTETWSGGAGWIPIGNSTINFSGTYDGQDHFVSNLFINRPSSVNQGLFGLIEGTSSQEVIIENLTVIDASINGYQEVGALVGLADQWVDIINCHSSGTVSGNRNAGGLAGWGQRTNFLKCSSSANVEMNNTSNASYHGGLIGHISSSSIVKESFATGNVSGRGHVGGFLGAAGWSSQVENCFARGNVESDISNPMIGGLIGEVWNAGVRNSYSTGIVDMTGVSSDYGGLVGNKTSTSNFFDEDNFWDTQTSGLASSEMGTGKTTGEMKTQSTFSNWDFATIWGISPSINNGYPHLVAQLLCTDPAITECPGPITAPADFNQGNAIVDYTVTATGTPSPTLTYSFSGDTPGSGNGTGSGSAFNTGTTEVTVTATNSCGSEDCVFSVTVTEAQYSISGTLKYNNADQTPMNSVELTISPVGTNAISTTDGNGYYSFTGLYPGTYTIAATNINKPVGYINSTDASAANAWNANQVAIEHIKWMAGDVNLSYTTQSTDAKAIQNYFVYNGNPEYEFDRGDWVFMTAGDPVVSNTDPNRLNEVISITVDGPETINIYGQAVGDFNGSFVPGGLKSASATLSLIYRETRLAAAGSEVMLPVTLNDAEILGAASLILDYPEELFEVTGVSLNMENGNLDWFAIGGELRVGWNSLTPLQLEASGLWLTIHGRTSETFSSGNEIRFTLAPDPLNELSDSNAKVIPDAKLGIDVLAFSTNGTWNPGPGTWNMLTLECHPNPFADFTTLVYTLPAEGSVTLGISDMLGRSVAIPAEGRQISGHHTVKLDATSLRPGMYVATLKCGEIFKTIKLVRKR